MNVSLTPELDKFVADKVASGRYASSSEVVRQALRLLEEQEQSRASRLEVGSGMNRIADAVVGGWELSGIASFRGGLTRRIEGGLLQRRNPRAVFLKSPLSAGNGSHEQILPDGGSGPGQVGHLGLYMSMLPTVGMPSFAMHSRC